MDAHTLIPTVIFFGLFLAVTALLKTFSEKISFPYTVALLIIGFLGQAFISVTQFPIHVSLSTDVIYFVLLPLLLFESAMKMNAHQFRLQFKTITFLATFGVLLAIFTVGVGLSFFLGYPFIVSILFGALISATDPIAVLSLFKSLGAPRRLALLAEGESMFNDATAVIAFRVILGFILIQSTFQTTTVALTILNFLYVFIGSLIVGGIMGYITAQFIALIENDRLVETTLTIALALMSFTVAEHFFQLSGVISTVAAGVVLGNVGRTKISGNVIDFMHELWEYLGFVAVSMIFFFATFEMDIPFLLDISGETVIVILVVLVARAISVYGSFAISNSLSIFNDEPNVPMSWQHVLNWGGLRGVIPLVLVYSLPDSFALKEEFLAFTLATFLFTLFINATTITPLLKRLGLHIPAKEERIIEQEQNLFSIQQKKQRLAKLSPEEFNPAVIREMRENLDKEELVLKEQLFDIATPINFERSLRLQAIDIERKVVNRLYHQGHINEAVFFDFDSELNLQQDALEYPEVHSGRAYSAGGHLDSQDLFNHKLDRIEARLRTTPFLNTFYRDVRKNLLFERFALLQSRIVASAEVISYLSHISELVKEHPQAEDAVKAVQSEHEKLQLKNSLQMQALERDHQKTYQEFERRLVESYAWA